MPAGSGVATLIAASSACRAVPTQGPIAAELVPSLRASMNASTPALVFPNRKGGMMSRQTQLEIILRRALKAAGIIVGYQHK